MNKKIKKVVLFFVSVSSCSFYTMHTSQQNTPTVVDTSALKGSPTMQNALVSNNYNPVAAAQTVQQNNITQANYFFSQLPQANTLPVAIKNEITRVYIEGLGLPSAIVAQIEQLYSLLYLIAEEEALVNQFAPSGTLPTSGQVAVPANFSLTGQQLIQSKVWQDYLKIKIAYSYDQELNFLGQIHQNELQGFQFLPQFELNFYQDSFVQLRTSSQLTRFYLLMTERLRERYLSQCTDWQSIVNATDPATLLTQRTTLFNDIETFKTSDFYTTTMQFESVDPESTFPLSATAQPYATSTNFPTMFSLVNGKLTVNGEYASFFEIDPTSGNVIMTGLGSLVYTGNIVASTTTKSGYVFETTPLFQKLFVPQSQPNGTTAMSPTLGYMELLCFSAIKALNVELAYLFSSANLAGTLQKINSLGQINIPFFIFYQQQDYMFLDEINQLIATLNNNSLAPGGIIPQSWFSSFCHFFSSTLPDTGKKVGEYIYNNGLKDYGENIYSHVVQPFGNAIEHAGLAVLDGAEAGGLYIGYGIAKGLNPFGANISTGSLLQSAQGAASAALSNIQSGLSDLKETVDGIVSSISSIENTILTAGAYATGGFLYAFDPKFASDYINMFEDIGQAIFNKNLEIDEWFIETQVSIVKLAAQAVEAIAVSVGDLLVGNYSAAGGSWKDLGESVATAVLSSITLAANDVTAELSIAMQSIGYIISCIVDAIEDISAALATVFTLGIESYSSVHGAIDAHRALISSIVTVVVVVGVTVATGGAGSSLGAAMLAMNVAQMGMNIVGTVQQEQVSINQIETETDLVNRYAAYVATTEINLKNCISAQTASYEGRMASQIDNQNRTLGFYQNWINDTTNCSLSLQAQQIGALYNYGTLYSAVSNNSSLQATPMIADPGYSYGIQTGRLVLNPGLGFLVYNEGRQTFGQEIATPPVYPHLNGLADSTSNEQIQAESNWFTVKDLSNIPAGQPLQADIIFRSLYESGQPFYIGIYLTERFLDIKEMNTLNTNFNSITTNNITLENFNQASMQLDTFNRQLLDYDNLAKMFVCYRDSTIGTPGATPQLGVYVHNTQKSATGWLQSPTFKPINFMHGQWYRMQAVLDGKNLEVAFWELDDATNITPVSAPPANAQVRHFTSVDNAVPFTSLLNPSASAPFSGSMGVIACGAAVEYKVLTPSTPLIIYQERDDSDGLLANQLKDFGPVEAQREQDWQTYFSKSLSVAMPSFPILEAYSEESLLAGQNIYTITGTPTQQGTLVAGMKDYVVLTEAAGASNLPTLGVSPSQATGFVSFITGAEYSVSGGSMKISGIMDNPLACYQKQVAIDPTLLGLIRSTQTQYINNIISQKFTFNNGSIILQADKVSLENGLYIYQGPAISSSGEPVQGQIDYYMLTLNSASPANILPNQILSLDSTGINFDGMISLSTGEIFILTQTVNKAVVHITCTSSDLTNLASLYFVMINQLIDVYSRYKSGLTSTIRTFIQNAQILQTDKQAIANAQAVIASVGSATSLLSTPLSNATSASQISVSIPSSLSTASSITTAQQLFNTSIATLNTDITNIKSLIDEVNSAITKLQSYNTAIPVPAAAIITAATTTLNTLSNTLSNAVSSIKTDTNNVYTAKTALDAAIKNATPVTPPGSVCSTLCDATNGFSCIDGICKQQMSGFVDPVNWCKQSDDCCLNGGTNSCQNVSPGGSKTSCGYIANTSLIGSFSIANVCPNCNPNNSKNSNGDSISYQCCVYGGPANCADTYPNCVPSQANDDCRIPGK